MRLNQFDVGVFLAEYWQKKPMLIRQGWKSWSNPLAPDELAGLACEDDVESRLIQTKEETWELEHGPISVGRFDELKDAPWTLLVQSVNLFVEEVADLIAPFRFIPDWRIDDVMVSYATDGGGVGPHYDQYDVFLIQGLGRRRWRIGQRCDRNTKLLPHEDLRLLAEFEASDDWILEPGDILYVPPGVAHDGVAIGHDCMTYSVGFRAPSQGELVAGWSEDVFDRLSEDDRYSDPELPIQDNPGEITPEAIAKLYAMATEKLLDRCEFGRWFGRFNTSPKAAHLDWQPESPFSADDVRCLIEERAKLERNGASRFSFIRDKDSSILLFVDGECYDCRFDTAQFAEQLCANSRFTLDPRFARSVEIVSLLTSLLNQGSVAFEGGE